MPAIKNAHIRYRIIDRCLRNPYKQFPSIEELRRNCEDVLFGSENGEHISKSTIEKDLFAMREEMDAPIKYNKAEDGYFYTDESFSINNIPLSEDEIESLKFATKTLMQFKDVAIFEQFGLAINKIFDRVVAPMEISNEEDTFIQFDKGFSTEGNLFLPTLLEAIKSKFIVSFDYRSFVSGISKLRKVLPLLLKEFRNRWYLISFDFDKNKVITYALDRMKNLEKSEEKYIKEIDFSPKDFFKYSTGITAGNGKVEKVLFHSNIVASKYIQSQPFHNSQKINFQNKDGVVFELKVIISEELIRDFLSYGSDITVIEPDSLKNEIHTRLSDSLRNYE